MADLVLFDAENPRSLAYQLERLRTGPEGAVRDRRARHGPSGWSTRSSPGCAGIEPADLEEVTSGGSTVQNSPTLLDGMHADLRDLSGVITATHLSLPGGMQPLWGPDERRVMP